MVYDPRQLQHAWCPTLTKIAWSHWEYIPPHAHLQHDARRHGKMMQTAAFLTDKGTAQGPFAVGPYPRKCTRRGSGRRCKNAAMRQQTSSVGQVAPLKCNFTNQRISDHVPGKLTTGSHSNCWIPIARTSSEETGATSPKRVISWCRTCWTWAGTSQDTQKTNLFGAMSRHWGRATSGYWRRSCHKGYLPC